jgi:hypothetical protein
MTGGVQSRHGPGHRPGLTEAAQLASRRRRDRRTKSGVRHGIEIRRHAARAVLRVDDRREGTTENVLDSLAEQRRKALIQRNEPTVHIAHADTDRRIIKGRPQYRGMRLQAPQRTRPPRPLLTPRSPSMAATPEAEPNITNYRCRTGA